MKILDAGELARRVKDLPVLPSVVIQVNRALGKESSSTDEIGEIIEKDSSLTTKLLKLANSSYYGLSYSVDTVKRAISVLGFNTVRNIAVTVSVDKIFRNNMDDSFDVRALWEHSLGCALASKLLLGSKDPVLREEAFVCGIIHDIGKVVIARNMPDAMREVIKKVSGDKVINQSSAEKEIMGFTHADVGALVAENWHFPEKFSRTIKFHHHPGQSPYGSKTELAQPKLSQPKPPQPESPQAEPGVQLLYAVYAGNILAKMASLGKSPDSHVEKITSSVWSILGRREDELPEMIETVTKDFEAILSSWNI